jgi:hypothetical protein
MTGVVLRRLPPHRIVMSSPTTSAIFSPSSSIRQYLVIGSGTFSLKLGAAQFRLALSLASRSQRLRRLWARIQNTLTGPLIAILGACLRP